jgi:hypothetical protein
LGRDFEPPYALEKPYMSKAVRIFAPISAPTGSSDRSDDSPLVSIALFSGIGLLASLIAILMGVPCVWY